MASSATRAPSPSTSSSYFSSVSSAVSRFMAASSYISPVYTLSTSHALSLASSFSVFVHVLSYVFIRDVLSLCLCLTAWVPPSMQASGLCIAEYFHMPSLTDP